MLNIETRMDRNKMGDSVPLKLALPELKYPIGSQPKQKSAINQYSGSEYISIVDSILKPDEMIRVRGSFLGPIMKLSERGLKLSAKMVYAILTRSIVSVKENEAWFHFGAQPLRFSIREFHMMTGLKCSGALEGPRRETDRFNWELLKGRSHKLSDVVEQLRKTREDASEERVCLAMLILVESILLRKSKGGSFPLEYAKNAQDMTYPWGKEAYIVLLKSIQNTVANHLENKSKFELQGYPLVFLLWILESIPLLRNKFSKCVPTVEVPGPTYLCEKYTDVENPSLDRVLQVEADTKLKVHCILPSIPHDPEDDISIEDKYSDELETLKDVTKKGYKLTADDWENRCVDTFETLDALIQMMANKETGQASTPIDEDSVNEKVNRIIEVMEENLKSMKNRMSLLEEENMHLRARVSELEGNNNVFPTNVTQQILYIFLNAFLIFDKQRSSGTPLSPMSHTQPSSETPLSPMSQQPNLTHEETMNESDDDTPALDTQVFSPNLTKEKETSESPAERPSNPNQDGKPDDEIVREKLTRDSPAAQSQVSQKETVEMNETPSSPIAPKSIETPVYTPSQTQQIEREPSDDTPALDSQIFTPNLTKERETQTSTDETPPKTNQEEGKTNDEIVIESPAAQTQVSQKETLEMNETPSSPISPKSIEAQVFTPIQKQQGTYEATQPLTEIISANNKKDTHDVHHTPSSPLSSLIALVIEENKNALDVESRVQNTFEIGANVEISSQDDNTCHKWYPGNVLAAYLVDGVEMVKVEYSAPSLDEKKRKRSVETRVSIDRIRPQPPHERPGAKKSYELMDDVEVFDNGAWCAGKVKVILFDGTFFVSLNNSTEQIHFNHSEMRKPRKWVDGVWKMTEKIEEEQTQSVNPSEGDGDKKGKAKAVACKKKKKANAQPVDLLPFLQREEKRPIRPRNPPMPVTPKVILPIDPFVTPEFPRFSRLAHWMDLRGIYRVPFYINGREIEKEFFQKMDDAEKNLNKEHINVAFEMLNCKRVEQGAWFRNNNLPAACFVPVRFLEVVGYAYESVMKPHKKKQTLLEGCVGELVKGLIHPKKVRLEDVDVIYGVIEDKLSYHYIGVEIQLIDNTITLFHCGLPKANIKRALNQIQELAGKNSFAIKMELLVEEVNFEDISPFQVKFAEGLPKTKFPYNCGIFVVKMLECRSLGLKSMANINDKTAMDLRSKLCCEIFDQFMDNDFQEGQRK
ncbi:unnamed protein product [Brassica oleracea]